MAIHSRHPRADARVTSGLLARSVLACLHDEQAPEQEMDAIGNMIRLLEMYRHGAFSTPSYHGVLERKPLGSTALLSGRPSGSMRIVESALAQAHSQVFTANQQRDEIVDVLEDTLRAVSERRANVGKNQIEQTKKFLDAFVNALTP